MNKLITCPFCGDIAVRKWNTELMLWGAKCPTCESYWVLEKEVQTKDYISVEGKEIEDENI